MAKQYGLVLPKKNQLSTPKAGNIFGNDEDSDEDQGTDWVKKALQAEHEKNKIKKQTKINMQKALKEDPTIFQYDEVYDEMERSKEDEKSVKKVEKKAKYIQNLLKSADLRKKEQELRKERVIQKEIEAEEAMFPDKERYVTSSYKKKLEEMKQFEEEQKNQDRLEAIGDVVNQKDMSGFYRHLYRQTVEKNEVDRGIVSEKAKVEKEEDQSESEKSNKSDDENIENVPKSAQEKIKKQRQYRKRANTESDSESDHELVKEQEVKKQKTEEKKEEKEKLEEVEEKDKDKSETPTVSKDEIVKSNKNLENVSDKSVEDKVVEETKENIAGNSIPEPVEKPKPEPKRKINIWQKRTIGHLFEDALERYLKRKEERSGLQF